MKKLTLTTTLVLGFLIGSSAGIRVWEDSTHKKPSLLVFERQIIISTDFERRLLFSFGGPQLLFRIDQHTKIGPAYFPTLWWDYKKGEFDTKLGIGLLIDHRRTVIGLQTFRVGTVWKGAFGLGYRF